jgi:hypothetical protein
VGELIVNMFVTLDGVVQAPGEPSEDVEGGFEHGGWQASYLDEESGGVMFADMAHLDALLLGCKTYEIFAAYWPQGPEEIPFTALLNNAPKTSLRGHWSPSNGTTPISFRAKSQTRSRGLGAAGIGDLRQGHGSAVDTDERGSRLTETWRGMRIEIDSAGVGTEHGEFLQARANLLRHLVPTSSVSTRFATCRRIRRLRSMAPALVFTAGWSRGIFWTWRVPRPTSAPALTPPASARQRGPRPRDALAAPLRVAPGGA